MTVRSDGFWADSARRFMARPAARVGLAWVSLLLLAAATAPFLCSSYPLRVSEGTVDRWPVLEAFGPEDWAWLSAIPILVAWCCLRRFVSLRRLVLALLVAATVVMAWRAEPRNLAVEDWAAVADRDGTALTWAPVRFGPDAIDKEASLVGLGESGHPFGTDAVGRDVFARLLFGARTSLLVGCIAAGTAMILGLLIGALAGWYRGRVDGFLSWLIQVVACFPVLVLVLAVCAFFQPSLLLLTFLIGAFGWTETARLVRGELLRIRELAFIESARALGASDLRVLIRHAIPHALGPVTVQAVLGVAGAVLIEATLAFLGLAPLQTPSWGRLLQEGRDVLPGGEHLILIPGLTVFMTICAWNLLGEAWRDATDPHAEDVS